GELRHTSAGSRQRRERRVIVGPCGRALRLGFGDRSLRGARLRGALLLRRVRGIGQLADFGALRPLLTSSSASLRGWLGWALPTRGRGLGGARCVLRERLRARHQLGGALFQCGFRLALVGLVFPWRLRDRRFFLWAAAALIGAGLLIGVSGRGCGVVTARVEAGARFGLSSTALASAAALCWGTLLHAFGGLLLRLSFFGGFRGGSFLFGLLARSAFAWTFAFSFWRRRGGRGGERWRWFDRS